MAGVFRTSSFKLGTSYGLSGVPFVQKMRAVRAEEFCGFELEKSPQTLCSEAYKEPRFLSDLTNTSNEALMSAKNRS